MSSKIQFYKKLPEFKPDYYHSWASDVESAFAVREWSDYLNIDNDTLPTTTTDTKVEEHKSTLILAHAFLNESIPYKHKTRIRTCKTTAQIWKALKEEYASRTREDELHLEAVLLDFKKLSTDSLSTHITKFSNLISAILAQQPDDQKYDDTKINCYFLRTLETANIPNEDWKGFVTSLGKSWLTISTHKLYSEARTYYNTHIMAQQKTFTIDPSAASLGSQDTLRALATVTDDYNNRPPTGPRYPRANFNDYSNRPRFQPRYQGPPRYQQGPPRYQGPPRGPRYSDQHRFPRNPNAYCTHCNLPGHSLDQCVAKTRAPNASRTTMFNTETRMPPRYQARVIRSLKTT